VPSEVVLCTRRGRLHASQVLWQLGPESADLEFRDLTGAVTDGAAVGRGITGDTSMAVASGGSPPTVGR
jgi:hypothetical protein